GRFIGEKQEAVRTVALFVDDKLVPNIDYHLENTPCNEAASKSFYICPQDVRASFPNDPQLAVWGVSSYAAISLFESGGKPMGLLGVLNRKPMIDPGKVERVIKLFASRAAAELERQWTRDALKQSQANLSALIESTDDMIWSVDAAEFRLQ